MTLPVHPIVFPSDLANQQNGRLNACSLQSVMFMGVGHASLHPLAARAWSALVVSALAQTKANMTITSVADAYRSFDQQLTVFKQRYRETYNPLTCTLDSPRYYQNKRWYKLKRVAPVATPGKSNHGWGLAVDAALWNSALHKPVSVTSNSTFWTWLQRNAESFGFSWELQSEPWHIRYFAGDKVPQRVLDVEKFLSGGQ